MQSHLMHSCNQHLSSVLLPAGTPRHDPTTLRYSFVRLTGATASIEHETNRKYAYSLMFLFDHDGRDARFEKGQLFGPSSTLQASQRSPVDLPSR